MVLRTSVIARVEQSHAFFYSWAYRLIDLLISLPTSIQSPHKASASFWNPDSKSGISSNVCPVMSKADAKPFKKVGSLKLAVLLKFFL
jgi:hypothetical protein